MKNATAIPQVTNPKGFLPSLIDALKSLLQEIFKFSKASSSGNHDDIGDRPKVTNVQVKVQGGDTDDEGGCITAITITVPEGSEQIKEVVFTLNDDNGKAHKHTATPTQYIRRKTAKVNDKTYIFGF